MSAILNSTITINRPVQVEARRIWDVCTEPISTVSGHWIRSMRTDADHVIEIKVENPIYEKNPTVYDEIVVLRLTPENIVRAFTTAVESGLRHCGLYGIEDLDNSDACTSDIVLQIACYGRVIY